MSMILFHFVFYLIFLAGFCTCITTSSTVSPECQSWQDIKSNIQQKKTDDINCVVNSDCTGIGCSGKYKDYDFKVDVKLNACEDPVTLDIILNVPKLSFNNTKHTFRDGQQYKLPKGIIPSETYIEVSLKHVNQHIILETHIKKYMEATKSWLPIPIIRNETINVPACPNEKTVLSTVNPKVNTIVALISSVFVNETQKTGKSCDMSKLKTCSETEICVQITAAKPHGECVCLERFHLNSDKNCVEDSFQEKHTHSVTLILAIAIPIAILMVCGITTFIVIKFRLIRCLHIYRQGIRSYEVVDIGNNEDDDEPLIT